MYRKNGHLARKNRANGRAGGGLGGGFYSPLQNCKEFHQVLDFQRFANTPQVLNFQ